MRHFHANGAWLLTLMILVGSTGLNAQQPADDLSQVKASLAAAKEELRRNKQEIDDLRQRLQQLEDRLGTTNDKGPTYPTAAIVQQEPQGVPAQPQNEDTQLLSEKINEMDQVKVESASKYKVRLSGLILMNTYMNRGNVDSSDLPNLVFRTGAGQSRGDFGATLRQSEVSLDVSGPRIGGAMTHANVDMDFFGGFPDTQYGVTAGLVRLRIATARMDWKNTSLIFGQDGLFFSPESPTSYASLGQPALSWSGNLWVWTPQVRVERRFTTGEQSHFLLQGGLLDPLTEESPEQYDRKPTYGERSRHPAFAGRVAWEGTRGEDPIVFGVGGYVARQNFGFDRNIPSWLVSGDWKVPLGRWLALSGEVYRGQAIGGLGGGIWQSALLNQPALTATTQVIGLNDIGGWSQLKLKANAKLEFNVAGGIANPFAKDLETFATPSTAYGFTPLSRNHTILANSIFRPRSNLIFALEYRHLRTYTLSGNNHEGDHLNLAVGVSF